MTATRIDRLAHGLRGLVAGCVGLAALGLACASAPAADEAAAPAPMVISEVRVASEASTTVVDLIGVTNPDYVDFRQDQPARIVLDLTGVEPGAISDSVAVYDGTVEEVSVAATTLEGVGVRTRVELSLAKAADYEVVAQADRLQLRVTPQQTAAAAPAPSAMAPAMQHAPAAKQLASVAVEAQGAGTVVRLMADGSIQHPEHFPLADPERLVIDLPGLKSSAQPKLEAATEQVKRVRVASHEGKVRVVIDGSGPGSLAGAQVAALPDGLAVSFGGAALPATAMAPAATPAATPAQIASASSKVMGVQYDAQAERERIAILTSDAAAYHVMQPDDETFLVSFPDASIDPDAAIRVAPAKPGAVSLVTAFQQPDAQPAEVRVVVRRAKGLVPDVHREGTMLFLDFKRSGDVAAGLPMLNADGAVAAMAAETPAEGGAVPAALGDLSGEEAIGMLQEGGMLHSKRYTGRRISLDFKDVEIADVLRLIADVSELNIIAGDEVKGEVTIRLVDVPWDQALDVILLTKGLGFVRVNNVLRIAPADVLKAEEEARLQERRAKEKLEDLVVKLQPVNYGNVKEIAKMVSKLLSARGTVDVDGRTNTLIIKDINSVIDEATALVKAIDTQTPQVLIESKIVEANLDFSRELGSVWAFGTQPLVDGFDESSGDRQDLGGNDFRLHDNSLLGLGDSFNNVSVANPITSVANGLLDLGAFLLDEKLNIELQLQAAESNGEGKVISSPRVVTLDNRRATIEQGLSIPFQTFENGDAKLEFIDAVLKLDVTPHITADRSIIMKVEVQRNAPDDSVQTPTGSPAIAKNEATTETLVKDGQTLVIGGIYVVRKSERSSGVPYFNKIPILGNAFKNKESRDIRQELLVFVTPRIVVNPEVAS
jgi:type IV pilus assembly protein PilQ